jgi:hypothetical protein
MQPHLTHTACELPVPSCIPVSSNKTPRNVLHFHQMAFIKTWSGWISKQKCAKMINVPSKSCCWVCEHEFFVARTVGDHWSALGIHKFRSQHQWGNILRVCWMTVGASPAPKKRRSACKWVSECDLADLCPWQHPFTILCYVLCNKCHLPYREFADQVRRRRRRNFKAVSSSSRSCSSGDLLQLQLPSFFACVFAYV